MSYATNASYIGLQTIVEIHHMLSYVERSAGEDEAEVARLASDAQCSLYNAQLDHLEERLHSARSDHSKSVNYFATGKKSFIAIVSVITVLSHNIKKLINPVRSVISFQVTNRLFLIEPRLLHIVEHESLRYCEGHDRE